METVDVAARFAEAVDGYAFAKGRDLFWIARGQDCRLHFFRIPISSCFRIRTSDSLQIVVVFVGS